jgi:serine phosphatase RsbU (regulator of sigma subunit)
VQEGGAEINLAFTSRSNRGIIPPFLRPVIMPKAESRKIDKDEQIYQLITLVAGRFSLQEALDKLAEGAVKITGVKACSIRLLDEGAGELYMRSTYGLSEEYRNKGAVTRNDPVIKAAFAGEAVVLDDMRVDDRVRYKEATIKEGLVSQLTVAMKFRDKAIGVLRLYSPEPKHFGRSDISLARVVASQCAVAITNARLYAEAIEGERMAEQMRLAGLIQRRMIPESAPKIPGLEIAAMYIPCFDVGGDLYDFLKIGDHCIAVVIADVIGKGMPAAIMMSSFQGAVRAYVDAECDKNGIGNIIAKLNRMACNSCKAGEFITLFYAVIDADAKTMTYCNCGHEPTLLIRGGGITELQKGGIVLGVEAGAKYETETIKLQENDCLLFYTDGLVDAANFEGDFWGRERMIKVANDFAEGTAEQMIKNMLVYRRRFVGLARQFDDTSVIVVKVKKTAE